MKSLKVLNNPLSNAENQIKVLENQVVENLNAVQFKDQLKVLNQFPLQPSGLDIFQINIGKMCNQVCKHCHVDAGPDRKEIMTWDTMELCLKVIKEQNFHTVDLTGGAPEMNPEFRNFVIAIRSVKPHIKIIVRCNLTIILANPKYHDLPEFFKDNRITVVSSLPYYEASKTDRQRGDGVFEKSIQALRMLNSVGYGIEGSGLELHLVYNPAGAFLPGSQDALESRFKKVLADKFHIVFNDLYAITNLPISRFLDYLIESGNIESYLTKLIEAFNPNAVEGLMCRNTLSIGWDGFIYDCDFNQMLEMEVDIPLHPHIRDFNAAILMHRAIRINEHCYGCTAGMGSSCGGVTT
jgi:radical SAM/Cys-rich protein